MINRVHECIGFPLPDSWLVDAVVDIAFAFLIKRLRGFSGGRCSAEDEIESAELIVTGKFDNIVFSRVNHEQRGRPFHIRFAPAQERSG